VSRAIAGLVPLLCTVGLLSACRTPPAPGVPLPDTDPRPAALLEAWAERTAGRVALRALADLDLDAPDLSFDRPQRLAVARPARLRVEVLGLFDQIAAVVVTDGDTYQVYDARSGQLEEGAVGAHLLWRVARVDLEPAEAVDLVLGMPRPGAALDAGDAQIFEDGAIAFSRVDGHGVVREQYRFDGAGRLAETARFDAAGALLWRARFSDYRAVVGPLGGEEEFAFEIDLAFPRVEARARLDFAQVVLVDALPDALFALKLPGRTGRAGPAPARGVAPR